MPTGPIYIFPRPHSSMFFRSMTLLSLFASQKHRLIVTLSFIWRFPETRLIIKFIHENTPRCRSQFADGKFTFTILFNASVLPGYRRQFLSRLPRIASETPLTTWRRKQVKNDDLIRARCHITIHRNSSPSRLWSAGLQKAIDGYKRFSVSNSERLGALRYMDSTLYTEISRFPDFLVT